MVPSTIWLLRRKRLVAVVGSLSCLAGVCIVFASPHWFSQQTYSVAEPLIRKQVYQKTVSLPANLLRPTLETALFKCRCR